MGDPWVPGDGRGGLRGTDRPRGLMPWEPTLINYKGGAMIRIVIVAMVRMVRIGLIIVTWAMVRIVILFSMVLVIIQ